MRTFQEKITKELSASPEKVWEIISAVDGVDHWFSSMISSCKVEHGKRYCQTADGIPLVEEVLEVNHDTRTFRFSIPTQELLPAEDIVEVMKVSEGDNGKTIVEWSCQFKSTPENGTVVQEAFKHLWNLGLEEMDRFIAENKA